MMLLYEFLQKIYSYTALKIYTWANDQMQKKLK